MSIPWVPPMIALYRSHSTANGMTSIFPLFITMLASNWLMTLFVLSLNRNRLAISLKVLLSKTTNFCPLKVQIALVEAKTGNIWLSSWVKAVTWQSASPSIDLVKGSIVPMVGMTLWICATRISSRLISKTVFMLSF